MPPWGTVALLSPAAGQFSVLSFVHIRVNSWFKTTRCEDPAAQISGWKARATKIRVHSCSFVVQNDPQRRSCRADLGLESTSYRNSCPFVFIRGSRRPAAKTLQGRSRARKPELQKFVSIRVHSWFKMTRCEEPSGQISGWKARATKIRVHSCSFVVQKHPQRRPFSTDLGFESPSHRNSCPFVSIRGLKRPAAKTLQGRTRAGKPELQKFVIIRVNSWFKTTRSEDPAGQISGWKARATKIRDHSCPFVVQNDPQRRTRRTDLGLYNPSYMKFVVIRVHSWFKTTPSEAPAGQNSGWKARATKIRDHSCPFVVQNDPQRRPFRADLGLESPSYRNSCPFVSIRGKRLIA